MTKQYGESIARYKTTLRALKHDPELLWLPAIGAVAYSTVAAAAFGLAFGTQRAAPGTPETVLALGFLGLFFLGIVLVTVFLQAMVVACVLERAQRRNPTLGSSWRLTWSRRGPLIRWALATTVFAFIAVAFARAGGVLGRIVAATSTIAWGIATVFVVPTIMAQQSTMWSALRSSERTFRHGIGQNLAAMAGLGLGTLGITLCVLFVGPPLLMGGPLMIASAMGASEAVAFRFLIGGLVLYIASLVFMLGLNAVLHAVHSCLLFVQAKQDGKSVDARAS